MRNGHSGGIIRYTIGVVEFEDGSVSAVQEKNITFMDSEKLFDKLEREFSKWQAKKRQSHDSRDNDSEDDDSL